MRILILNHEYTPIGGGGAAASATLARQYVRYGHDVIVVTMGYKDLPSNDHIEGVKVYRIDCGRRRKEMASAFEALFWAIKAARFAIAEHDKKAFDATHCHFVMPSGIAGKYLQKKRNVPYFITLHGSDVPGYNKERFRFLHRIVARWWLEIVCNAKNICVPSNSLMELLKLSYDGEKSTIVPYGFESDFFKPKAKIKRILLCSRLVERKSFHIFLKAISDLELSDWEIDIVGDGPMYPLLVKMAEKSLTKVNMLGWIDNSDPQLAEIYGRAMIFVFPSVWENLPISLMEGMSAGCAVICADVAGNPEVLGDCGLMVKPKDEQGMRNAVIELINDPERCNKLGTYARERVEKQFNLRLIAKKYLKLFGCPDNGCSIYN